MPSGFTLIELVLVLSILVALAGIVLQSLGSGLRISVNDERLTPSEIATRNNLKEVRSAILGSGLNAPGYREDVGRMPDTVADLLRQPDGVADFNPAYGTGWRGPYLQPTGATYIENFLDGFSNDYGEEGDPAILDAWGHPIVIQNANTTYARLVSAGENGEIEFPANVDETTDFTTIESGDDLIVFLIINDPRP